MLNFSVNSVSLNLEVLKFESGAIPECTTVFVDGASNVGWTIVKRRDGGPSSKPNPRIRFAS